MNIKQYRLRLEGMTLSGKIATIVNNINQKVTRSNCLITEYEEVCKDIKVLNKMLEEIKTKEAEKIIKEVE